jgi:hypothetical protein
MVPVVDAMRRLLIPRDRAGICGEYQGAQERFRKNKRVFPETAEEPLFNIGRIPGRQSRLTGFAGWNRQILPPGRKDERQSGSVVSRALPQTIEKYGYFLGFGMARSLLISAQVSFRKAAPRVQCHVRSSSKRVLPERAVQTRPARPVADKRQFRGDG